MCTVLVYSGDTYWLCKDALEQQFSFNLAIMSERWKKVLFNISTFGDDIQVAIKAGKSDQFYEELNVVYPKIINSFIKVEEGDAIIFLYL